MEIFEQITKDDAKEILEVALSGGGDFADLYVESRTATSILCEEDRIENISTGIDCGAGIRVVDEDRVLYIQTNDLTIEGLKSCRGGSAGSRQEQKGQPQRTR